MTMSTQDTRPTGAQGLIMLIPLIWPCYFTIHQSENCSCSVQLLSCVQLFVTPWTAVCQASLSIINSRSLPKLMSIESVIPSNHLILLSPSSPTFNLSQHQGLFKGVSSSHQGAKILEFQLQPYAIQKCSTIEFLIMLNPCYKNIW